MGIFKRKAKMPDKPKKMDLSKYKIKMTIKSICMYEKLSGNSFFAFTDEDIAILMYCIFCTSNDIDMKYTTFCNLMENEQIALWMANKYKDLLDVLKQFPQKENTEPAQKKDEEEEKVMTMTDLATSLIIDYHMDAHYVMYEMGIWEIEPLYETCDAMVKRRYEEERLWAYIDAMPHIDSKKVKGPSDLLPFPWEKEEKKKRAEKNLKNNAYAVKHTIGMNMDDLLNGKQRTDNNS